jgi:hypothetical protein
MNSVSHRRAVEQDEDLPELLLLAHSPHVFSVLFGVSLDGVITQLQGNHASDMTLRGFHVLFAHLVLILGVRTVLMVLGIRLYLRCKLNGPIGKDDYAAILATTLGIAQSALVLTSVNSGLGRQHPSVQDDLIDDDKIAKAILSPSSSIDQPQTNKTRWHMSKTDSIIFGLSSLAMQRLSCILQRLTSPELRVACCTSA